MTRETDKEKRDLHLLVFYFNTKQTMKTRDILSLFAAVALMTACSSADEVQPQGEPQSGTPIQLQSAVDGLTRAGTSIQTNQLLTGEQVNVYITAPNGGATYEPKVYRINTGGEMAPVGNIFPYFPTNGNGVDVYALYPVSVTNTTRDFTVQDDQDKQQQYKQSDLMFGTILDGDGNRMTVSPTATKQTVTFKHKLSKITVKLISGKGSPNIKNSEIQLCNVYKKIAFTPSSGALSALYGDPGYIKMTSNGAATAGVSAIIPPQTIGTGYFLKVRLTSGDVIYYSPQQSFDVESGKEYKFNMTINQDGLTVNYTVSDWLNTEDAQGNATNVFNGEPSFSE